MTIFGVGWPWGVTGTAAAAHAHKIRLMGCTEVRIPMAWNEIEKQPGKFDWSYVDARVKEIRDGGLGILPVVYFSPIWHRPDKRLAPDPGLYANFLVKVAEHFQCPAYEIWNETNWRYSETEPLDWDGTPQQYAALYKEARAAMHWRFGTRFSVVLGGLAFATGWPGAPTGTGVDYLRSIWRSLGPVDAVGWHPYAFGSDPAGNSMALIQEMISFLAKRVSRARIDITEIGLPVGLPDPHYSEKQRAAYLTRLSHEVQDLKRVRRFNVYTWHGQPEYSIAEADGSWKGGAGGYAKGIDS